MKKSMKDVYAAIEVYGDHFDHDTLVLHPKHSFRKGLVQFIYRQVELKKGFSAAARKLKEIAEANGIKDVSLSSLATSVRNCYMEFSSKSSKPDRDWEHILTLLDEVYKFPKSMVRDGAETVDEVGRPTEGVALLAELEVGPEGSNSVVDQPEKMETTEDGMQLPGNTRCSRPSTHHHNKNCSCCKLNKVTVNKLRQSNKHLRLRLRDCKSMSQDTVTKIDLISEVRKLKQVSDRKAKIEANLRKDKQELSSENATLKMRLKQVKNVKLFDKSNCPLDLKLSRAKLQVDNEQKDKIIACLRAEIMALEMEIDSFRCEFDDADVEVIVD